MADMEISVERQRELDEFYRRNPEHKGSLKLFEVLEKRRRTPNMITLAEFEHFMFLFQKPPEIEPGSKEEFEFNQKVETLSEEYKKRVNLFKWTIVVVSDTDHTPVPFFPPFPPVFMSLAPPPMDELGERAFNAFRRNMSSDIPAQNDKGDAIALEEIKRAQNDPDNLRRIVQVRRAATMALDEFKRRKQRMLEGRAPTDTTVAPPSATKAQLSVEYNKNYADTTEVEPL